MPSEIVPLASNSTAVVIILDDFLIGETTVAQVHIYILFTE